MGEALRENEAAGVAPDQQFEEPSTVSANDSVSETAPDATAAWIEAQGYTPDVVGHGFADAPPEDEAPASLELDEQGSAMQALIDNTLAVENLGNELNRPAEMDGGYQLPSADVAPVVTDSAELVPADTADNDPVELTPPGVAGGGSLPEQNEVEAPPIVDQELVAEVTPEVVPTKEVSPDILNAYQERFGINPEELKKVEGFEKLSSGQQKQVLENLAQLTIGKIKAEAVDAEEADYARSQENANVLKRVWNGLKRSIVKQANVVNLTKKGAAEIQKGGMKEHEETLKKLVDGMNKYGPAVKEGENGELEVQFIETEGMSPEVAKVAEAFNEQGTKFSKIPYEWGLDTATKEQREAYENAKETYELQRGVLIEQMKKAGGKDGQAKAIAAMAATESSIEMQRFVQTCPDSVKELARIENDSAWEAALKSVGTERGIYMAGGAALRTAFGVAAGFLAAPLASAAMAGMKGWKRSGDELAKQDEAQRRGEVLPDTEEQKAAKARIAQINVELANIDDERVKAQLQAELPALTKAARGTTKNMIEAFNADDIAGDKDAESGDRRRGATAKIEYLKARIASVDQLLMTGALPGEAQELEEEKAKLVAQLDRRLNYTKMKLSQGRMVFGDDEKKLDNQYALMRSMSEAEGVIATETASPEDAEKAEKRLAKLLNVADTEIKDARLKKKIKDAVKAGVIGGGLAFVGASAADLVKWFNGSTGTLAEKVFGDAAHAKSEIADVVSSVKEGAVSAAHSAAAGVQEFAQSIRGGIEQEIAGAGVVGQGAAGAELFDPDTASIMQHPGLSAEGTVPQADAINGLDLPPDYKFPDTSAVAEGAPRYTVEQGDNLSRIFAREIPDSTNPEVIRVLRGMTAEQLRDIGVSSGNPDVIYPGDKIDVNKMRELLATARSQVSGVPSTENYVDGSQGLTPEVSAPRSASVLYENDGTPSSAIVEPTLPESEGDILGTPDEIRNMMQGQSMNGGEGVNPTGTAGIRSAIETPSGAAAAKASQELGADDIQEKGMREQFDRARENLASRLKPQKPEGVAALAQESGIKPPKSILEVSNNELAKWPKDQARPWPTSVIEANKVYGYNPDVRATAGEILRDAGRYPNPDELDTYLELKKADPAAAERMLGAMRSKPLSENEITAIGKSSPKYLEALELKRQMQAAALIKNEGAGIEAGNSVMRLNEMSPRQAAFFRRAIESYAKENNGVYPDNVTLKDLLARQLMLEPRVPIRTHADEVQDRINEALERARQRPANNPMPSSMPKAAPNFPDASGGVQAFNEVTSVDPAQAAREAQAISDFDPEGMDKAKAAAGSVRSAVAPSNTGVQIAGAARTAVQGSNSTLLKRAADVLVGQQSGMSSTRAVGEVVSANSTSPTGRALGEILKKI